MEENKYNSKELIEILSDFYHYCSVVSLGWGFHQYTYSSVNDFRVVGIEGYNGDEEFRTASGLDIYNQLSADKIRNDFKNLYINNFEFDLIEGNSNKKELSYKGLYSIDFIKDLIKTKLCDYFKREYPKLESKLFDAYGEESSILEDYFFFFPLAEKLKIDLFILVGKTERIENNILERYKAEINKVKKNTNSDYGLNNSKYASQYVKTLDEKIIMSSIEGDIIFTDIKDDDIGVPKVSFNVLYSNFCDYIELKRIKEPNAKLDDLEFDFKEYTGLRSVYTKITELLEKENQFDTLRSFGIKKQEPKTSAAFQFYLFKKLGLLDKILTLDIKIYEKHTIIARFLGTSEDTAKKLMNGKYPNQETTNKEVDSYLKEKGIEF